MSYRSRVVAHGPHRGEFDSRRAESRSASAPRAPTEAPANPHQTQSRLAPDIALRAKRRPSHDGNRLLSDHSVPP